jgi:hypothetical protein
MWRPTNVSREGEGFLLFGAELCYGVFVFYLQEARVPAVHNGFYIFNTRSFKAGCLLFGATTLCLVPSALGDIG